MNTVKSSGLLAVIIAVVTCSAWADESAFGRSGAVSSESSFVMRVSEAKAVMGPTVDIAPVTSAYLDRVGGKMPVRRSSTVQIDNPTLLNGHSLNGDLPSASPNTNADSLPILSSNERPLLQAELFPGELLFFDKPKVRKIVSDVTSWSAIVLDSSGAQIGDVRLRISGNGEMEGRVIIYGESVTRILPTEIARHYRVVEYGEIQNRVNNAYSDMHDPESPKAVAEMRFWKEKMAEPDNIARVKQFEDEVMRAVRETAQESDEVEANAE